MKPHQNVHQPMQSQESTNLPLMKYVSLTSDRIVIAMAGMRRMAHDRLQYCNEFFICDCDCDCNCLHVYAVHLYSILYIYCQNM